MHVRGKTDTADESSPLLGSAVASRERALVGQRDRVLIVTGTDTEEPSYILRVIVAGSFM